MSMELFDVLKKVTHQEDVRKVSPKLEIFRPVWLDGNCPPGKRIKGARGGRGAGAKSWSVVSLICQMGNKKKLRIICLREIQKSLAESVYELIRKTVERLGYKNWKFTDQYIEAPNGTYIIFRGMKDLRAAQNIKGLEGFDIYLLEEAASISMESLDMIMPTVVRNENAELWFCYNPETDFDPITVKIWNRNREDAICVELLPGKADNPWWNDGLQNEMELDYKFDPVLAEHVWMGLPKSKGEKCVMSRAQVRAAVSRVCSDEGIEQLGIDVARFGHDNSVLTLRKGMVVKEQKTFHGQDTQAIARLGWDMVERRDWIPITVDDTGVGGGVTDKLRDLGANVQAINFASKAKNQDKYDLIADELWFEFPIDEIQIIEDPELIQELSSRQYDYDRKNRRVVESKAVFRKRCNRSPDKADSLLLAFYQGKGFEIPDDDAAEWAGRYK